MTDHKEDTQLHRHNEHRRHGTSNYTRIKRRRQRLHGEFERVEECAHGRTIMQPPNRLRWPGTFTSPSPFLCAVVVCVW